VTRTLAVIVIAFAQMLGMGLSWAQSSNVIGSWKVEITFGNGESRAFRFDARGSGTGSLLLLDPRSKFSGPPGLAEAKWIQSSDGSVLISGPVQFPLGNVAVDQGTLVLNGKFGTDGAIAGEAKFFPLDQDSKDPKATPSKSGSFKATRIPEDDRSKTPSP
jgi:hypothetical protein